VIEPFEVQYFSISVNNVYGQNDSDQDVEGEVHSQKADLNITLIDVNFFSWS
jgi:hypothetical protein